MRTVFNDNEDKMYIAIRKEDKRRIEKLLDNSDIEYEGYWSSYSELYYDENSKKIMKEKQYENTEDIHDRIYDIHEYIFDKTVKVYLQGIIEKNMNKSRD